MLKSSGFLDTSTEGDIKYILIFKKHPKNTRIQIKRKFATISNIDYFSVSS